MGELLFLGMALITHFDKEGGGQKIYRAAGNIVILQNIKL